MILSLGLSMDCFGVSIINGMAPETLQPGTKLKVAFSFAMAHCIMIIAGFYLGGTIESLVKNIDHWIAFLILSFVGLKMIVTSIRSNPLTKAFDINKTGVILSLSVATSIDALIAGTSIPFLNYRLGLTAIILTVVVFIITFIGIHTGQKLGLLFGKRAGAVGGIFLIAIGIANLLPLLIS